MTKEREREWKRERGAESGEEREERKKNRAQDLNEALAVTRANWLRWEKPKQQCVMFCFLWVWKEVSEERESAAKGR